MATRKRTRASSSRRRADETDATILVGLIRAPWSDWWAREQEERGRSFSGQDVYDAAPGRFPRAAQLWGVRVANEIERMNGTTLAQLFAEAVQSGYPNDAEHFGADLGLQASGHGVSYMDDMPAGAPDFIKLPYREFYI